MNQELFKEVLEDNYPSLTSDNLSAILNIVESVIRIPRSSSSENVSPTASDPAGWAVLDPLSTAPNVCQKRVMVLASDRNILIPQWPRSFTLRDALKSLTRYYRSCQRTTKLGLLVTNVWRPGELSIFKRDIEFFEQGGIQSVAILVSNHSALPINWPWR